MSAAPPLRPGTSSGTRPGSGTPARPRRIQGPALPAAQRRKLAGPVVLIALVFLAIVTGSLAGLMLVYSVDLPQIDELESYRPSTTTELYDIKGRVIGSFALERREIVGYGDFAPVLRHAVISIEDKSFESHWGINVFRVAGAAWHDLRSRGRAQGASTLTMQLARNLFLSADRTPARKIQEAFLAIQIERRFTKQQIFTLYGNQIYLGHGMYGFEAASEFYFGNHAKSLTLAEAALLAGLPKGPVAFSPLLNPEKAIRRRNLVLAEMEHDKFISPAEAERAMESPLGLRIAQPEMSAAPWFQEEVRRELEKRFGAEQVHEAGLKVQTSLDLDLQQTANRAVADGLAAYERRHGWTGKLQSVLGPDQTLETYRHPDWAAQSHPGDYIHALVTSALPLEIRARIGPPGPASNSVVLLPEDWKWTGIRSGDALARPGDILYLHLSAAMLGSAHRATVEQDSGAEGALMAIDNTTGDVLAMVGGRDYALSQFNRATQAERQTGSSFKPYVYAAAVEDGAKPSDVIVDAPVSFGEYTPHNYEGDYKGAMTLLNAFAESRNIPALKLAAQVGIHKVIDMAHRFGITSNIPAYLPVALGAADITLDEQVSAYSVFPNDGVRVAPRLVRKVSNADGIALWEAPPSTHETIGVATARTMMTLLREVTARGTGAEAARLNHPLGGKTGTTSDFTDAWFLGFSPSVTSGVWVGYDNRQSLGEKETGARAALPIWIDFMKQAIQGKDNELFPGDTADAGKLKVSAPTGTAPAPAQSAASPPGRMSRVSRPAAHGAGSAVFRPESARGALAGSGQDRLSRMGVTSFPQPSVSSRPSAVKRALRPPTPAGTAPRARPEIPKAVVKPALPQQ